MIDTTILKELFESDDMILKYLKLFSNEVPSSFQRLVDNFEKGKMKEVSIESHSLKSQFKYLNAIEATTLATDIEQISEKLGTKEISILKIKIKMLEDSINILMCDINDYVAKRT